MWSADSGTHSQMNGLVSHQWDLNRNVPYDSLVHESAIRTTSIAHESAYATVMHWEFSTPIFATQLRSQYGRFRKSPSQLKFCGPYGKLCTVAMSSQSKGVVNFRSLQTLSSMKNLQLVSIRQNYRRPDYKLGCFRETIMYQYRRLRYVMQLLSLFFQLQFKCF